MHALTLCGVRLEVVSGFKYLGIVSKTVKRVEERVQLGTSKAS